MRLSKDMENQFVREYLLDLNAENAATRCGVRISQRYYGNALLRRPQVQRAIALEMESRRLRLKIDADFVLAELVRQYWRLMGLVGHDIGALYDEQGALRPVADWPAVWRERLVTELHTQDVFERSSDGVQAGDSRSWDKTGTVTRIKRETALAIEKEIRETLRVIGQHMNVKAFPVPQAGNQTNIVVVTAEDARKAVSGARLRVERMISPEEGKSE